MRTLKEAREKELRRISLYISALFVISVLAASGWMFVNGTEAPLLLKAAWFVSAAGIVLYYQDTKKQRKEGLVRDLLYAVWTVCIIVLFAYSVSATWPVMVAIESGSMLPNMEPGDLVFVLGSARTRIVTYAEGGKVGYTSFGRYGDVIVYRPNGYYNRTPIIHRAMQWVNAGDIMPSGNRAPYAGYITQGDNNKVSDVIYNPVKPDWVVGVAKFRVPYIGYFPVYFFKSFGVSL